MTFMKSQTIKTLGGVMSAVALISGGAGVAQAATVDSAAPAPAMPVVTAASDSAAPEAPGARTVEGSFSYDQDAVTANAEISGVFCKAAATLCASLPTYGCEAAKAAAVTVAGPNASFTATLNDWPARRATSYVMACSCATNVAGGAASRQRRGRASLWRPLCGWPAPRRLTQPFLTLPTGPGSLPSGAVSFARILQPYCGPAERSVRIQDTPR
ncbi:MAG: hypothetical protein ACLUE1_06560 [Adlercreutzia equolifaciens]